MLYAGEDSGGGAESRTAGEARGEDTYFLISWTTMFAAVGEKSLELEEEKSLVEAGAGAVVVCSGGRADAVSYTHLTLPTSDLV